MSTTIYTIPFAGGSKYSYNSFRKFLPENVIFEPLELPGRGERITENLVSDLHLMADDLFEQIKNQLPSKYIIYAHSMGTILGYLLCKKLMQHNLPLPKHLVFTGSGGPSNPERERERHLLPKKEFKEKLEEYGGSPDEVLANEELFDFFEPILRNDFKAVESYIYEEDGQQLPVPITVIFGSNEKLTREEVELWKQESDQTVSIRQLPGGHFFIFDYPMEIVRTILKTALV